MASYLAKLICVAILCLVLGASSLKAQAGVTCDQVVGYLSPCMSYLRDGGSTVSTSCCDGIKTLEGLARTTANQQNVCNCIPNIVKGMPESSSNLNLASNLPKKCGVNIPYLISPSTDCNRVRLVIYGAIT